jgi:hypothetical protein
MYGRRTVSWDASTEVSIIGTLWDSVPCSSRSTDIAAKVSQRIVSYDHEYNTQRFGNLICFEECRPLGCYAVFLL